MVFKQKVEAQDAADEAQKKAQKEAKSQLNWTYRNLQLQQIVSRKLDEPFALLLNIFNRRIIKNGLLKALNEKLRRPSPHVRVFLKRTTTSWSTPKK